MGGSMNRVFLSITFIFGVAFTFSVSAQESSYALEEVVVTANKKEENVQDVASTINVVSEEIIENFQVREVSDISQFVSGVSFTKIDPRRQTITMRGLVLDPDGGNDQPIQVYLDEQPVRPSVAFAQMYDIERIELLKGAQGTLQGVVSIGGSVLVNTKAPSVGDDVRDGYIKTSFASNNLSMFEFGSSFQLSDTMALRIAGVTNSNNGNEVQNIRTHVDEEHDYDSYRLTLAWQPTENLSSILRFQRMDSNSVAPRPLGGNEGVPGLTGTLESFIGMVKYGDMLLGTNNAATWTFHHKPRYDDLPPYLSGDDGISVQLHDPRQNNSGELLNLHVDYDAGSHLFSLRYSDYQNDIQGIIDRDYAGAFAFGYPQEVRTNSGIETFEFRVSNQDNSKLEYTLGFFSRDSQTFTHADEEANAGLELAPYQTFFGLKFQSAIPSLYESPFDACNSATANPMEVAYSPFALVCVNVPLNSKTEAVFANFKYNISDKMFLQFGMRDQEIDGFRSTQLYLPCTAFVTAAEGCGFNIELIPSALQNPSASSTTSNFKLGFYPEENVLLYLALEEGFRAPGSTIVTDPIDPSLVVFDGEDTEMMELGMKGTFLDGKLRLNVAYFEYDISGFQAKFDDATVRILAGPKQGQLAQIKGGLFANNDAEITGFDIEYQYLINANTLIGGSYSTSDGKYLPGSQGYTQDVTYTGNLAATRDVTGDPLNDAAESSLNFYIDNSRPAYFGGEYYSRFNISQREARNDNSNPDISIGELVLANLYLGIRSSDNKWDLNLFVKNLLDDRELAFISSKYLEWSYIGASAPVQNNFYEAITNPPRQIGVQLTYRF